jgi:3-hydroxypropionyl-CoA synthetase (ADP-forming)
MEAFFEPRGVAVIGASATPGKIGHEVLRSIVGSSYSGNVYAVNPNADEILGVRSLSSLDGIGDVDLAVIVLPAGKALDAISMACDAGAGAAVIVSGGFSELGADGARVQDSIVARARTCGMRIIGPNCIGIYNPHNGLDTFFQPREVMLRPGPGPVAFMTQSGTYGCTILEGLEEEGVGVSRFASYGNKADIDEVDFLEYLRSDGTTKVIAAYIEGLDRGPEFFEALRAITPEKPFVAVKAGMTEAGASAARSHTGALAGDYDVFRGVLGQAGGIMANDVEDLIDTVKVLSMQPVPEGGRVAMVTNGVGPCVIAADLISQSRHLEMAELSDGSVEALSAALPNFMIVDNPVDLTGSATADHFVRALDVLYDDENVDIVLPFLVIQDAPLHSTIDRVLDHFSTPRPKTTVVVASGGPVTRMVSSALQEAGVPVIPTASRTITALDRAAWYGGWCSRRQSE